MTTSRRGFLTTAVGVGAAAVLKGAAAADGPSHKGRRPDRRQGLGLLWVVKLPDNRIEAYCSVCRETEAVISGWEDTIWADGMMPAIPMTPSLDPGPGDSGENGTQRGR